MHIFIKNKKKTTIVLGLDKQNLQVTSKSEIVSFKYTRG